MNISIPYSWLKDYIKTNANVDEISKVLSLHSFSVEKVEKINGDDVFIIEVTPNRGDALSVLGVARELRAVLPRMGYKCEWVKKESNFKNEVSSGDSIEVLLEDETLVPRFSAIVMDNVKFGQSSKLIRERLEMVGIRPLGNVIDITNYMMIDKGQPMHVFDYEKILGQKMIVRKSLEGEVITTLDDVERKLSAGVIVIEDGEGRLIDLCGIMGAKNSEVDENTTKILLFVQVYDPVRIRKASMSLGHRTDAALRFEKGIDFEGVIPALWESADLISKESGAKISSDLIDIVNYERSPKNIYIDYGKINKVAGVEISPDTVDNILNDLGFEKNSEGFVVVPSWRYDDVNIIEDIAEEVIRIYGYYNLTGKLLEGEIPVKETDKSFYWEDFTRTFLKYNGFFDCYTYSATSKQNVSENALKISNPLSEDILYLKTSLLPQLLEIAEKNKGYNEKIKIFELASVYFPDFSNNINKVPEQPLKLGILTKGVDYIELKGTLEALFKEMNLGDTGLNLLESLDIREFGRNTLGVEIDFQDLVKSASRSKSYTPLTSFNSIKEDLTFEVPEGVLYPQIEKIILESDERIYNLNFKDIYNNYLTFSIEYLDKEKQVSSEDTQVIREKIFKNLEKIGVRLKL